MGSEVLRSEVTAGDVIEATYPFVRDVYAEWDEDGCAETPTWRPGARHEEHWRYGYEDEPVISSVADGLGRIILSVVSVHKPGRYATRVFYTRRWRDPDGREFGKNACRVTSLTAFRALARGYRHPYALNTCPTPAVASQGSPSRDDAGEDHD